MTQLYKKLVIKIGSNVLTREDGLLDMSRMAHLTGQIANLRKQGVQVLLVSSGAVAAGRGVVNMPEKTDAVARRQVWAAVGQVRLMQTYNELFALHGTLCSQVLVTKEDFRDRLHYINLRSCFAALLQHDILPIVNENDVVSVTELMFTDNDELAGLIAAMVDADALLILTNVDGIFNGNPAHANTVLIPEIESGMDLSKYISTEKSNFGRGGMLTKANIAKKVAKLGIAVHLANGRTNDILLRIIEGEKQGTFFKPQRKADKIKKWIAYTDGFTKGIVYLNEGAKTVLLSDKAHSLLPVGIVKIKGEFEKGDIIRLMDENENLIGLGMAQYSSEKALEKIGKQKQIPLVHYNYLFVL
jgi:glutamate 5-kinase